MARSTEDLVGDASRGDHTAIEALLQAQLPGLMGYVRHRAGQLARKESASDLVQSVCREVLERLADERFEYRGEAAFKQWLYQAALLKIRARARYWKADKRDVAREIGAPLSGGPSREDAFFQTLLTPGQEAMRHEELERAKVAFEQLPDNYREIIELARIEGLPHREVAERLGIDADHSRVLLSRALARLATVMRAAEG